MGGFVVSKGNPRRHQKDRKQRSTGAVISAQLPGSCGWCRQTISPGDRIINYQGKWCHESCVPKPKKKARQQGKRKSIGREFNKETRRILAGETFAGTARPYRRTSPGKHG